LNVRGIGILAASAAQVVTYARIARRRQWFDFRRESRPYESKDR